MNKYLIIFVIVCVCFGLVYSYEYRQVVDVISNVIANIGNTANEIFTFGEYRVSEVRDFNIIDYYDYGIFEAKNGRIYSINEIIRDKMLPDWYDIKQSNLSCTAEIYNNFVNAEFYQLGNFGSKKNVREYSNCIRIVLNIEWNETLNEYFSDNVHNVSYEIIFSPMLREFYYTVLEYDGNRHNFFLYQPGRYANFESITDKNSPDNKPSLFISSIDTDDDKPYYINLNDKGEKISNNKDMYSYVSNIIIG